MSRTLAPGRFSKVDPGEAFRKDGLINALGNKGIFGNHLDQFLFEAHGYEHIWGAAAQVSADVATITWDQAQQRFEDKSGTEVILDNYDRIAVIGMDTLTDNIVIDNITGLEIFHINNTPGQSGDNPKFQLGDAGFGVPFKILLGPGTSECKLDLQTDKTFADLDLLATLGISNKQFIANQGKNNQVRVNGDMIYDPSSAGQIIKYDTQPVNPYLLRMDGALKPFSANAAVNGIAWFRDLNIALNGQRSDGSGGFTENQSRFTPIVTLAWLFKLNTANRFFTDISSLDSRIHERSDPTGVSITPFADFVNTSNTVTFQGGIGSVKNGMRINGAFIAAGIPESPNGTTILRNIDTTAGTAQMFNALTGVAVTATATTVGVGVTINNSGAAGGSHDADTFQNITGNIDIKGFQGGGNVFTQPNGALSFIDNGGSPNTNGIGNAGITTPDVLTFDASISPSARTHDQTQPISSAVKYFYKV